MVDKYKDILTDTLAILNELPVVIPDSGLIVGFSREYIAPYNNFALNDNFHYPFGTSFLNLGLQGIVDKAKLNKHKFINTIKYDLLEGIELTYLAIIEYIKKYILKIDQLLINESDSFRLVRIKKGLENIIINPPKTFLEGMQLYYFIWKIRGCATLNGDLGRLDYHLLPLYNNDIANGVTEDEILNIIVDFYELLNKSNSGDTLTNITLGGLNCDGTDSSSRLSYLFLKANLICKKTEPHLNVRVNDLMRKDVYDEMIEVQYLGHGQANSYFDDTVIPALINKGYPKECAYAYTNDGCTEITFDGYAGIDFNHIDIVACLECAIDQGKRVVQPYFEPVKYFHKDCPSIMYTPDIVYGYDSGDPTKALTFDELYNIFLKQFKFQIIKKADLLKNMYLDRKENGYTSFILSGTYEKVLEEGTDLMRGGFVIDYYQMFSGSITTCADSLIALKHAIYIDKIASLEEIKDAINHNYEGYEVLRRKLLSYPKFGNDIDEVDNLSADIAKFFSDTLDEYNELYNFRIAPDLLGWRFLEEAYGTSAGFDGRKYAEGIAEHYCATPGKAVNGPTALINSIGKADLKLFCGVAATHISLPRNMAETKEESLEILKTLNKVMWKKGFIMMSLAIYDVDKLKEAQANPSQNEDVIIRVWGYSAKFIDLCKEMQDHVISRIINMGE